MFYIWKKCIRNCIRNLLLQQKSYIIKKRLNWMIYFTLTYFFSPITWINSFYFLKPYTCCGKKQQKNNNKSIFQTNKKKWGIIFLPHNYLSKQLKHSSADLEVQFVQLNHCDGVYSNYWNTLLRNLKLSLYINF